ncbi:MAG TPA: alpha/beta fold hydrolase, partial [Pirellulales bacterium]
MAQPHPLSVAPVNAHSPAGSDSAREASVGEAAYNRHVANWRDLYPFHSHYLALDGLRYHYLDEGRGQTLLCVHGNPTWSFYWRRLVSEFSNTHRVVAVDHIGCGLSGKPQKYNYSLAQHITNLVALIDRLDLRDVTLLAHDWGGAIGLGATVERPERFSRLVLFNTGAYRSQEIPLRIAACRWPVVGPLAVRGLNGFAGAAIHMATSKPERFTPAVTAGYLAPYDNWANRVAVQRFVEDIPLSPSHPTFARLHEIESALPSLGLPTKLIWGMQDWCFTPRFLERFEREFFPHASSHRFHDCGHYVVEDAHERIVPLLRDFLNQPGGRSQEFVSAPPASPPAAALIP